MFACTILALMMGCAHGNQQGFTSMHSTYKESRLANLSSWTSLENGSEWRCFSVATVKRGPLTGLRAVGLGSNQDKLKREANLTLANIVLQTCGAARTEELAALAAWDVRPMRLAAADTQSGVVPDDGSAVMGAPPPPPPPLRRLRDCVVQNSVAFRLSA